MFGIKLLASGCIQLQVAWQRGERTDNERDLLIFIVVVALQQLLNPFQAPFGVFSDQENVAKDAGAHFV